MVKMSSDLKQSSKYLELWEGQLNVKSNLKMLTIKNKTLDMCCLKYYFLLPVHVVG